MASVICLAGLDPSGHAGISADIRALEYLGLRPLPIVSVLTVQNSTSMVEFQPVSMDIISKQYDAVMAEERPAAAKLGILGSAELAEYAVEKLSEAGIPIVTDPVLATSTGHSLVDDELLMAYREAVIPRATVVTPNAHEASVLSGIAVEDPETAREACEIIFKLGPKAVLVKGGHFHRGRATDILYDGKEFHVLEGREIPGELRGTGCTLSSLIAGHIAMGQDIPEAAAKAKQDFVRAIEISSQHGKKITFTDHLDKEKAEVWHSVNRAVTDILTVLPPKLIAEVGNNIAFALPGANGPEDICSLDSRMLAKGDSVITMGTPVFGRKSHVGRVVLAAMSHDKDIRCAMNLRFSHDLVRIIGNAGLSIGEFSREEQPEDASSMEWGTGMAISDLGHVPDAVFDTGGIGKEPMVRLLARNPQEILGKLRKILEAID